jgi:hypothetical protein
VTDLPGLVVPVVESFLMAEDIRTERNGQISLVGVFTDRLYSRTWPLVLPKLCFLVRIRGLDRKYGHTLTLSGRTRSEVLGRLDGHFEKPVDMDQMAMFSYEFLGVPFREPGSYIARFALSDDEKIFVQKDYVFCILNPNPEEMYLECKKCQLRYGTGIAMPANSAKMTDCHSPCPRCQFSNLLDSTTAFHLPNPV